ncbi:MAG TPA: hypothetical protein VHM19_14290 [Polyangiales bacterium]|nr:hypothetical protein [Polyangiales bacterium]
MTFQRWLIAFALLTAGCFTGHKDDTSSDPSGNDKKTDLPKGVAAAAAALTESLGFDNGTLKSGDIPDATTSDETVAPFSEASVLPGAEGTLSFNVQESKSNPAELVYVQVDGTSQHFEIENAVQPIGQDGDAAIELAYTVSPHACDAICNTTFVLKTWQAVKFADGSISKQASSAITLDCREDGDPARCADATKTDGGAPSECTTGTEASISIHNVDKVDLLFVVDNSGSMREEQAALKDQFPKLIDELTQSHVKDLHVGVVSVDMGLIGIAGIAGCDGLGDDGLLMDPTARGCSGGLAGQRFLSYVAGDSTSELATNLGCLATLGTDGCGFEQQLESPLKALWPSVDTDPQTGKVITPNRITFLKDTAGNGGLGHGDRENQGFLRNDAEDPSLIAVVVVTDEEDCSSQNTSHFTPMAFLDSSDPNYDVDLNLRCFKNKQNLYPIERYVNGLQALRAPADQQLVIFEAIAGVPPDLVDSTARANVDFSDDTQREAFYDKILADPRMQEKEDPTKDPGNGNLVPSCVTATSNAFPPIRLVQVARGFGANGTVHSICNNDFAPAMDSIIELITRRLGAVCLPRPLVRNSNDEVDCSVVWELPPPAIAAVGTPTTCDDADFAFLQDPQKGFPPTNDRGGNNCVVDQLAMTGTNAPSGDGWYYDDASDELKTSCDAQTPQRIAFTSAAKPPSGVTVKLICPANACTFDAK